MKRSRQEIVADIHDLREDNKRLEATNADLLAALETVLDEAESAGVAVGDANAIERLLASLPQARAAIARAKGESSDVRN